jgi:hypothetical protein
MTNVRKAIASFRVALQLKEAVQGILEGWHSSIANSIFIIDRNYGCINCNCIFRINLPSKIGESQ